MILKIADFMHSVGKNERGLTLIELMIVLAIVAIIAALAIPQIMGWLGAATEEAAEADANSLTSAIQMRALRGDVSPSSFSDGTTVGNIEGDDADEDLDHDADWALGEFIDLDEIVNRYDDDENVNEVNDLITDDGPFDFDEDEAKVRVDSDFF